MDLLYNYVVHCFIDGGLWEIIVHEHISCILVFNIVIFILLYILMPCIMFMLIFEISKNFRTKNFVIFHWKKDTIFHLKNLLMTV